LGKARISGDRLSSFSNTSSAAYPRRRSPDGGDQRRLVDHRSACDVDERSLQTQRVEHIRVDEVPRVRPALAGDHKKMAPARQLDDVRDELVRRVGLPARTVIENLHVSSCGVVCA
jgi:hypothetical protein